MSKGIFQTIAGGLLIATGVILAVVTFGASTPLTTFLISAGAGMLLSGIGTLIQGGGAVQQQGGLSVATRNPIAPWVVVYGQAKVGGTYVFIHEFGDKNKYLDLVLVLANHTCEAVDAVYFDQQRIQIGANNTSFTPVQQNIAITSIKRVGTVVTVVLPEDIPLLGDGDQVIIENVHPLSAALNGKYPVQVITRVGGITFTYLCGGTAIDIPSFPGSETGNCKTTWRDVGTKVYFEALLGTQVLGQTFAGLGLGTPSDGDPGNLIQDPANTWTAYHSLVGMTAVFLRLQYDEKYFSTGLPQLSFLVRGKNDIYDVRTSTYGYTENAALCIADYLSNSTWGFRAAYGTDIPTAPLIAAANICDEPVDLAVPDISPRSTEPRYTCNGLFPLTMRRSEVLQNLLTSCAGRLTYEGGQFSIWPAAWGGVSATLASTFLPSSASAPYRWRPTVSVSNLFNGVKGVYVSPVNGWQPSDFPRYAQDSKHGYSDGAPEFDYDSNLEEDGGERRWLDIQLPFTISCSMAQRIAKIELLRRRWQGTGTFALNMAGYRFTPMDVLSVDLNYFGWNDKYVEVLAVRFKLDRQQAEGSEAVMLGTEIDVQETDPSIYEWSIGEELSPEGYQQAIVPDNYKPLPPTNVRITNNHLGSVTLSWDQPQDAYVLHGGHIEAEYQVVASPEGLWISLGKIDPTITKIPIPGLLAGVLYYVRIRSVNAAGIPSDWVYIDGLTLSVIPLGQWAPHQVQAPSDDALFPNEWTYDLEQSYEPTSGVDWTAIATATGAHPVRVFIPDSGPVLALLSNAVVTPTGGSISGGTTVYVSLGARDGDVNAVEPSVVLAVEIPTGTNTNKITISDIVWSDVSGLVEYVVYASTFPDLLSEQQTGSLTPSSPAGTYSPSSIVITGPFERSTYGIPDPGIGLLRMKGALLIHGGVEGGAVDAVTTTTLLVSQTADVDAIDDWAGRVLAIIGRNNGAGPFCSFDVTAFDPATGLFTVTQDPVAAGVEVGDAIVVCTKGLDNSGNPFVISDPGLSNAQDVDTSVDPPVPAPHAGLVVDDPDLLGTLLLVIKGKSRGMAAHIVSNTATTLTLDSAIPIDATSVWVIIGPSWPYSAEAIRINNSNYLVPISIPMTVSNAVGGSILVAGFTVDAQNNESLLENAPVRMLFVWGAGMAEVDITADYQMLDTDQTVFADASGGAIVVTLPDKNVIRRGLRYIKKIDDTNNPVTIQGFNGQTVDDVSTTALILTDKSTAVLLPNTTA